MGMIKITKNDASATGIYINTDYIQSVRPHPNVRRGPIPTVIDMMDGNTRYQVIESVEKIISMINEKDIFN